jgi:putative oxidoreductase
MAFSSNRYLRIFLLLIRLALGGIFIYAGYAKLRDPWELFALGISSYNILPLSMVEFVARTLPWFEVLLGLALIVGIQLRYSSTVCSLLLLVFFGLLIRAYVKGMEISCGCFGAGGGAITWRELLRDGSMLAGSLLMTAMAFLRQRKTA